jgi:hypothetical protein
MTLSLCLIYLARHDTEAGHVRLIGAIAAGAIASRVRSGIGAPRWTARRISLAMMCAWAVPIAAMTAISPSLTRHCRFAERPIDDIERLALWCRDHTTPSARFVMPPGPKTFRTWSRRSVVFNRAASPYHAAGLADWADKFRQHVGFSGTLAEFAKRYIDDRQGLERRYDEMSDAQKAALARRMGADFVVAGPPRKGEPKGPLECLHIEGRLAVYRVRDDRIARAPQKALTSFPSLWPSPSPP